MKEKRELLKKRVMESAKQICQMLDTADITEDYNQKILSLDYSCTDLQGCQVAISAHCSK